MRAMVESWLFTGAGVRVVDSWVFMGGGERSDHRSEERRESIRDHAHHTLVNILSGLFLIYLLTVHGGDRPTPRQVSATQGEHKVCFIRVKYHKFAFRRVLFHDFSPSS